MRTTGLQDVLLKTISVTVPREKDLLLFPPLPTTPHYLGTLCSLFKDTYIPIYLWISVPLLEYWSIPRAVREGVKLGCTLVSLFQYNCGYSPVDDHRIARSLVPVSAALLVAASTGSKGIVD